MDKKACKFALLVAPLWRMPPIVRECLTTQNEKLIERAKRSTRVPARCNLATYAAICATRAALRGDLAAAHAAVVHAHDRAYVYAPVARAREQKILEED